MLYIWNLISKFRLELMGFCYYLGYVFLVLCMNKIGNSIVILGLRFIGKISFEAY